MRNLSKLDKLLNNGDQVLRTLSGHGHHSDRESPANNEEKVILDDHQKKHVAALMRINHTGEVCAQALYQGQAMTAKSNQVKESMQNAAAEEIDHLAWCEDKLHELDSRVSYLNPIWYALSFSLGAAAGVAGDKWSLGFVEETERQVCKHLDSHIDQLPVEDNSTRAILNQMLQDEAKHADTAREEGAAELPEGAKLVMSIMSKIMTKSTYHI